MIGTDYRRAAARAGSGLLLVACLGGAGASSAWAQALPPAGSVPVVRAVELCPGAEDGPTELRPTPINGRLCPEGNRGLAVSGETYLFYMEIANHVSLPSQQRWVHFNQNIERILRGDFFRLWDTGFLDDLRIEVVDDPYPNGVIGKHVVFTLVERPRVRIVSFEGSDVLKRTDIDTAMQDMDVAIRVDSFLDLGRAKRVEGLVESMFSANGYQFAEVRHEITPLETVANAVRLTFHMEQGPKVQIDEIDFIGNDTVADSTLKKQMKQTKERWWLSWITGRGTYKEALFEQDADAIMAYYQDQGYIDAAVGSPETVYLDAAEDGKTRLMRLRIPVDEGPRYRVGDVRFDGNEVVTDFGIRAVFRGLVPGEYFSQAVVTTALEQARELYGSIGHTDLTIFPDLQRRTAEESGEAADEAAPEEPAAAAGDAGGDDEPVQVVQATPQAVDPERPTHLHGDPIVDVTIRIEEGEQQFVNRITFVGNESTHDEVIRREFQLVENGMFSTSALTNSILRVNQLGYFEPLEEDQVDIEPVEGREDAVNLTVNLTEANLNQLTFGAGASQFDGFFGQVSFVTSNFLGRGETLSVGLQNGSRLRDLSLGYTKPYLLGYNLSAGANVFSRRIEWIGAFTQESNGAGLTLSWPLALFTRMFVSYSIERTGVSDVNEYVFDVGNENPYLSPFLADALLVETGGRRTVSKITPSVRLNTVDHPIFPSRGRSYTGSIEFAGIGGNTEFLKPTLEGIWYFPHTSRTLFGFRAQYQHIISDAPNTIPVFERLWLGGEYSIRGFDLRRIGPTVSDLQPDVSPDSYQGRTIIGGNKSLLLNAEYQFSIAQPVRLIYFFDVGQVQDFGSQFTTQDFKSSTGVEFRFFMPMLNVPFRLIYSWNPLREGVYNDRLDVQEPTGFRFAVGTTF